MSAFAVPRRSLAVVLLSAIGLVSASCAQTPSPAGSYQPSRGQAGKDVIWIPSPDAVVDRMLQMAEVTPNDRVVDLGSGDGKIAIAAARNHGARAHGLEYNPQMVELSNKLATDAGVADKVSFRQADIFQSDFSSATVVTMYLLPELNLRLRPILFKMTPGTRVVSHSFNMGEWIPDEIARAPGGEMYMWRVPANASGQWRVTTPGTTTAPEAFSFTQKFQFIEGRATFGQLTASIVRPHMSGENISFEVRDRTGALLQVDGKVAGNRIVGTIGKRGQAGAPFEAARDGQAETIAGIVAGQEEMQVAARVLSN